MICDWKLNFYISEYLYLSIYLSSYLYLSIYLRCFISVIGLIDLSESSSEPRLKSIYQKSESAMQLNIFYIACIGLLWLPSLISPRYKNYIKQCFLICLVYSFVFSTTFLRDDFNRVGLILDCQTSIKHLITFKYLQKSSKKIINDFKLFKLLESFIIARYLLKIFFLQSVSQFQHNFPPHLNSKKADTFPLSIKILCFYTISDLVFTSM